MLWCDGPNATAQRNIRLADRTTFGIGGPADFLVEPSDESSFAQAHAAAVRRGLPIHILGGGSNVLVADEGIDGVVLSMRRLDDNTPSVNNAVIRVRAGTPLARVIHWTVRLGLAGLESLAGIPGSVGGAVRMNAGAGENAIGDRVAALWCSDGGGGLFRRDGEAVVWGYRRTDIAHPIVAVELALQPDDPEAVRSRVRGTISAKCAAQPVDSRSAGCFFKNPPGDSAGRLIDGAGLKGRRAGDACVSPKHANFIINDGDANAGDVMALCDVVQRRVAQVFNVVLEHEVCCWPMAPA